MVRGLFRRGPRTPGVASIKPFEVEIPVAANQSVLQAALEAGVDFPHSCKVGTCTMCRCKLTAGRVKIIRDFSYVLSAAEVRDGYILACQSKVRPGDHISLEVELETDRPRFPVSCVAGVIAGIRELTHDIRELRVRLERPMFYAAGQYASLRPLHLDRARDFSFAAAPGADGSSELTFYVRHTPGGSLTDWLFRTAKVGETLMVEGPLGDFWMRRSPAPLLFVAGGSGLAPIRALLEETVRGDGAAREATFLFGARTQRDLYDLDAIADIGASWRGDFKFVPVLSDEPPTSVWPGARGLVTELISAARFPHLDSCHAYLCGPPRMIDAALPILSKAGIPHAHIHYDKFLDASGLTGRVTPGHPG